MIYDRNQKNIEENEKKATDNNNEDLFEKFKAFEEIEIKNDNFEHQVN